MHAHPSRLLVLLLAMGACGESKRDKAAEESAQPETSGVSDAGTQSTVDSASPDYAVGDTLLLHRELTIDSSTMGEKRHINIYLPPGYEEYPDARYPILYMPDGGIKEDFPHLTHTVDTAIRAGQIRPIIVVGIENTQRRRDLTGPTDVAEDRQAAPVVGGSATFRRFIRDELFPEVDEQVRGNGTTGVIGESLAGLFVVETLFLAPEMFDLYIAIDPTLQWNDGVLGRRAVERLEAGSWPRTTLYLSSAGTSAEDGNSQPVAPVVAALMSHSPKQLRWSYQPKPDEKHSTIYRATKLEILTSLFAPE